MEALGTRPEELQLLSRHFKVDDSVCKAVLHEPGEQQGSFQRARRFRRPDSLVHTGFAQSNLDRAVFIRYSTGPRRPRGGLDRRGVLLRSGLIRIHHSLHECYVA